MSDLQFEFKLRRVYLKEASLEQPNWLLLLQNQERPASELKVDISSTPLSDGMYEVCVAATVHAKIKDQIAFVVEAKQAGIFEIRNLVTADLERVLGTSCPQLLYPYLRANIADLTQRGGLPVVHLNLIFNHKASSTQPESFA